MHEMSLMADLFRKIDGLVRDNNAKKVQSVRVWLGAFSHISADHFREHFEEGAKGGPSEGARLVIEESKDALDPHAQEIRLQSVDLQAEE